MESSSMLAWTLNGTRHGTCEAFARAVLPMRGRTLRERFGGSPLRGRGPLPSEGVSWRASEPAWILRPLTDLLREDWRREPDSGAYHGEMRTT